jgi:hypothetical protein
MRRFSAKAAALLMLTLYVFTLTGTAGSPRKGAFGFNSPNCKF